MALGVGLLMPPGADGRPMALYLSDLEADCGACGRTTMRRYFLSTRFHSLTLARLEQLLLSLPAAIEGTCEQCDATLTPEAVRRWSLQFSPGDGDGLIVGICDKSGVPRWRVSPHEFLDVQAVPMMEWADEDISSVRLDLLNESTFFSAFGRYLNPKSAVRRAILALSDPEHPPIPGGRWLPEGAVITEPAPGFRIWVGPAERQDAFLASEDPDLPHALLVEDGMIASGYPDAPVQWLSDLVSELAGLSVIAFAETEPVDASLRRHFSRFPVDIGFVEAGDVLRVVAGDGSEPNSVLEFGLRGLAKEAARTAAAPGDIARVEIDRAMTLLDLASRDGGS